jgi:hypothetical protein
MAILFLVYMYTNASKLGPGRVCECVPQGCGDDNAIDCTDGRICVLRIREYSSCCGTCVNNTTG